MKLKYEKDLPVLPDDIDIECIDLCNILNSLPDTETFESCCGHLKERYSIFFHCYNLEVLSRLGMAVDRNYSCGKWEIVVDHTDTEPFGCFWLRSKEKFIGREEMDDALYDLMNGIIFFFTDERYDNGYFADPTKESKVIKC